ncbi:DUF554 domain-containing protein [Vibrio sp.]|uniref:DUF554 domain-containing protein n=1 Tax=Vibrio viridaestus TaxID=2487322 RepID=A0A3N9U615_9VIBR|nr:DUF554 domain-containing protein [Vibrio viridaestus]MDC0612480.1 DUF554 domain-containing protein [Vibrio sp.]RQW63506.1 DUF554 domain-containing protein [Vibrio viridaestus]
MIGPFVNAASIILGGVIGTVAGSRFPKKMRERMPLVFGLTSMGLGIAMIMKVQLLPAMVLSMLIGTVIGEIFDLEEKIKKLAEGLKGFIEKALPKPNASISQNEYIETFISVLILFCVSGTGVFGSMNEGVTGDPTLLIVKSFLDFFTAVIFAIRLGFPVASLAIPQTIVQMILYFSASAIMPLTNDVMIADFSAVGGLVMFATGFRICGLMQFPVANMLPALIIAMPISALWASFV